MPSTILSRSRLRYSPALIALVALAACGGGGGGGSSGSSATTSSSPSAGGTTATGSSGAASTSNVVSITGSPVTSVAVGSAYSFQPKATTTSGVTVGYAVTNKPDWATFSTASGALTGTPAAEDAGVYTDVVITASTGSSSASLKPFSISVKTTTKPGSSGTATLSWVAPTTNSNGTQLTDLTWFRIYYGTRHSSLTNVVDVVADGNTSGFIVTGLPKGTYYFKVCALDSAGVESSQSDEVTKSVS